LWKARERDDMGIAPNAASYTVADALCHYFEAREHRGSKGVKVDRHAAKARIITALGSTETARLTTRRLRAWHVALAQANKQVRTKSKATERATKALDLNDDEAVRARRSTANRILTILKAALNYAYHEGRIASDEAWRKVKPFREVEAPVVRFLTAAECLRLMNACEKDFRSLVRGALLTGSRYGELTRLRAGDYNDEAGTVTVRLSKAGKSRHVVLNDKGRELFGALTIGRSPRELNIPVRGRWPMARISAAAPPRGSLSPREDRTPGDVPYFATFLRQRARHARRSHGRHSGPARAQRHANDREALRTSGAFLRCRNDPCGVTGFRRRR
jgi:integrase